jgi:hypothetical protein
MIIFAIGMKNSFSIHHKLKSSKIPMICALVLSLVILEENLVPLLNVVEPDVMELSENQEQESKSSSEKEIEDMNEFLVTLISHRFATIIKLTNFQFQFNNRISGFASVDTPPPEII